MLRQHQAEYFMPGIINSYTITAIDEDGMRSLSNTFRLAAFGSKSIISPVATGLRATVYSSTAAEILWDRLPNRALRYEIMCNDGLTNITNGSSYYDNKRVPGEPNTYLITTIRSTFTLKGEQLAPIPRTASLDFHTIYSYSLQFDHALAQCYSEGL